MRYQELLFSASVLGAAIALHNCRHPGEYALRAVDFPARILRALPRAAPARPSLVRVTLARRWSAFRLITRMGRLRYVRFVPAAKIDAQFEQFTDGRRYRRQPSAAASKPSAATTAGCSPTCRTSTKTHGCLERQTGSSTCA